MVTLTVTRDRYAHFEPVGSLQIDPDHAFASSFVYERGYLDSADSRPISVALPLQEKPFGGKDARAWFGGLVPEGQTERALYEQLRLGRGDYVSLLSHLRDETLGALVFCGENETPGQSEGYEPLPQTFFDDFARNPLAVARQTIGRSRLSLAGEMTKVGLYRDEASGEWFLPIGAAPSTHIVKAASGSFPLQTINEALCLMCAKSCDIETVDVELIGTGNDEPLICVRRYDRTIPKSPRMIDGHARPVRRHQEDMCQALLLQAHLKYSPSGADYLNMMSTVLAKVARRSYAERLILFENTVFDYIVGNTDNHLKNYAILYDESWSSALVAPLYDVTAALIYPGMDRDMGVSLCVPSRSVDSVTKETLERSWESMGLRREDAVPVILNLARAVEGGFEAARDELHRQGWPQVRGLFDDVMIDIAPRMAVLKTVI